MSSPSTLAGTGLFSGRPVSVEVTPACAPTGIRFHAGGVVIPATVDHVTADASWSGLPAAVQIRNTTLRGGAAPVFVATTEHLLSALAGLGLWHADVRLNGVEVPIFDGSSQAFVESLTRQSNLCFPPPAPLTIARRVQVDDPRSGSFIAAEPLGPGEHPTYTYEFDFGPGSTVPAHSAAWDLSPATYVSGIAPARTFSFLHEVEAARKVGLFAHLTPREMLVVGKDGHPVDNTWRFPDAAYITTEPARHKLLDLIGDLALLGRPLHARVVASRSGHALAHQFCRSVIEAAHPETSAATRA